MDQIVVWSFPKELVPNDLSSVNISQFTGVSIDARQVSDIYDRI
jgi:hypothetical protein